MKYHNPMHTSSLMLLVLAVLMMYGCTTAGTPAGESSTTQTSIVESSTTVPLSTLDWLLVASDDRQNFGMLALGEGTLDIDIDRQCVYLNASTGGIPKTPIIFVSGTQLMDADNPYIRLPNGIEVQSDEKIVTTGGWISADTTAQIPFLAHLDIPESCWQPGNPKQEVLLLGPFEDTLVVMP